MCGSVDIGMCMLFMCSMMGGDYSNVTTDVLSLTMTAGFLCCYVGWKYCCWSFLSSMCK